jgi:carbonic anhydrase/acetyltransferase-like protein (isoleucine patch superfamily)
MSHKIIIPYKGIYPQIDPSSYIAEGAAIVGDVTIGKNSSVWFNSVIRGDVAKITIGDNTNIQDGTVIHTSRFNGPTYIGNNITIGHMVLIHACTIKDNAFVGMKSVVMDHSVVEEYGFVAAGALVTPSKVIKSKELWSGVPAKFVRFVTDDELEFMLDNVQNYCKLAKEYTRPT